jgi:hypothetical protein
VRRVADDLHLLGRLLDHGVEDLTTGRPLGIEHAADRAVGLPLEWPRAGEATRSREIAESPTPAAEKGDVARLADANAQAFRFDS